MRSTSSLSVRWWTQMRMITFRLVLASVIVPWLYAIPAEAQSTRTYVSGKGKDSSPCTVTSPCRTATPFRSGAIGVTLPCHATPRRH
jgi:hypothetical protein